MTDEKISERRIPLGPVGQQVMKNLKRLRKEGGVTYAELADRLSRLGRPIPVLGLGRIERGERRVDVDDLAALAQALGVPPIMLLFPVLDEERVAVAPGEPVPTALAVRWFTGEGPLPAVSIEAAVENSDKWQQKGAPVVLLRQHIDQVERWGRAPDEVRRWNQLSHSYDDIDTDIRLRAVRGRIEDEIRSTRAEIHRRGLTPPPLPAELDHIGKHG